MKSILHIAVVGRMLVSQCCDNDYQQEIQHSLLTPSTSGTMLGVSATYTTYHESTRPFRKLLYVQRTPQILCKTQYEFAQLSCGEAELEFDFL